MRIYKPFRPTVLVVTKSVTTVGLLAEALQDDYVVRVARQSEDPTALNHGLGPDMVLLDVNEPGDKGHDICRQLKSHALPKELPFVFLALQQSMDEESLSVELGVVDHIALPINPRILKSRIRVHFAIAEQATALRVNNAYLESEIDKRSRELALMQDTTILALASLAETRDVDTANHLRRTQHYLKALADSLKSNARFSDFLSEEVIDTLFKCAPLHDIGKVGIPDRILLKPGRYEPAEFEIMKTHPTLGRDAIGNAQKAAGASLEFFDIAKDLVYSHHEKWDGTGYPQGLRGDDIPIPARLMALADVYDALISPRIYKPGMTHHEAAEIIVRGNGKHFDPDVVHAFLRLEHEFMDIAQEFADSTQDLSQKADYLNSALTP
jgi:putative two-component system response regulator